MPHSNPLVSFSRRRCPLCSKRPLLRRSPDFYINWNAEPAGPRPPSGWISPSAYNARPEAKTFPSRLQSHSRPPPRFLLAQSAAQYDPTVAAYKGTSSVDPGPAFYAPAPQPSIASITSNPIRPLATIPLHASRTPSSILCAGCWLRHCWRGVRETTAQLVVWC